MAYQCAFELALCRTTSSQWTSQSLNMGGGRSKIMENLSALKPCHRFTVYVDDNVIMLC